MKTTKHDMVMCQKSLGIETRMTEQQNKLGALPFVGLAGTNFQMDQKIGKNKKLSNQVKYFATSL